MTTSRAVSWSTPDINVVNLEARGAALSHNAFAGPSRISRHSKFLQLLTMSGSKSLSLNCPHRYKVAWVIAPLNLLMELMSDFRLTSFLALDRSRWRHNLGIAVRSWLQAFETRSRVLIEYETL